MTTARRILMEDAIDSIKAEIEDQTHNLDDEEYIEVLDEIADHCRILRDAKQADKNG